VVSVSVVSFFDDEPELQEMRQHRAKNRRAGNIMVLFIEYDRFGLPKQYTFFPLHFSYLK
jgi:hypothetical protein